MIIIHFYSFRYESATVSESISDYWLSFFGGEEEEVSNFITQLAKCDLETVNAKRKRAYSFQDDGGVHVR